MTAAGDFASLSDGETFLLLAALVMVIGSILLTTLCTGVPPMPSNNNVAATMLALVPADTRGVIYELGAGWGGFAVRLAWRCPAARVIAYELSPLPFIVAKALQWLSRRRNLEVRYGNFMSRPLGDGAVVTCYLMIGAMVRLAPKLRAELPAGALVVSNAFTLPDWPPERIVTVTAYQNTPVYLYRQPLAAQEASATPVG